MNLFYEAKKVLDKDGKVNPLGPYGKQKLTGREIQVYFRRNKVKDKVYKTPLLFPNIFLLIIIYSCNLGHVK